MFHPWPSTNRAIVPRQSKMPRLQPRNATWRAIEILGPSGESHSNHHQYTCLICGYGSIPIHISGMNIHKSQLFWGSLGVPGFWPIPMFDSLMIFLDGFFWVLPGDIPRFSVANLCWQSQRGSFQVCFWKIPSVAKIPSVLPGLCS